MNFTQAGIYEADFPEAIRKRMIWVDSDYIATPIYPFVVTLETLV